jgi:dynein light chain roadblock-type
LRCAALLLGLADARLAPPQGTLPPSLVVGRRPPPPPALVAMSEVEETMKKLMAHEGVVMAAVVDGNGIAIRSQYAGSYKERAAQEPHLATKHAALMRALVKGAASLVVEINETDNAARNTDSPDELKFVRLRTKKHELIVVPENNFFLVLVQEFAKKGAVVEK